MQRSFEDVIRSQAVPGTTSPDLIESAKKRDAVAWDQLVETYGPAVYRWSREAGLGAADAAEIVQIVFVAVALNFDRFRKERPEDSFRSWLKSVSLNKVRDHFRAKRRRAKAVGGSGWLQRLQAIPTSVPSSIAEPIAVDDQHQSIFDALQSVKSTMHAQTFKSFWLTVVGGLDFVEADDELGMTPRAVRLAKARVVRKLREACGTELNDTA